MYAVPVQRRLACAVDLRLSCDLRMSDLRLVYHSQVISIAHRLNFIRNSDRILVLNAGGTVNAFDTPAKLLEDTEGCESHNSVATQSQLSRNSVTTQSRLQSDGLGHAYCIHNIAV